MSNLNNIWKPSHWVLLEMDDLNGDKFTRLLTSYVSKHDGVEGWRLGEPITRTKTTPMHVEFTDTQKDTYVCDYNKEGLSEFLAKKYDEVASEQGQLFNRKVTILTYGEGL